MRISIQALIFSVALPTIAASTFNYDNSDSKEPLYSDHKLGLDIETSERQVSGANAPNFIRLVVMRLIYGIASTIGLEDRLEDTFNGAFLPPNADGGFGFGDFGGGGEDDGDGLLGDVFGGGDLF